MEHLLEEVKKILAADEYVKFAYRPNKMRNAFIGVIAKSFSSFFFAGIFILISVLMFTGVIVSTNEAGEVDNTGAFFCLIPGLIVLLFSFISAFQTIVNQNRTIYVVTNKRIIIRSGFIGADYVSLEFSAVGIINVRVDFLDKLVKPNTGSVIFGSSSAPIYNNGKNPQGDYIFRNIEKPYETYQEIKNFIDEMKAFSK